MAYGVSGMLSTAIGDSKLTQEQTRMTSAELERMSLRELRLLKDRIDGAIRGAIARSRAPAPAAPATEAPAPKIDLERERDAWKARRAASGRGF